MHLGRATAFRVSACIAFSIGIAVAAGISSIRGEIRADEPDGGIGPVTLELYDAQERTLVERVWPTATGSFEFQSLPSGSYELRLTDQFGNVIRREFVNATGAITFVSLRVPGIKRERPVSGTVSVETLQHKVPQRAERAFRDSCESMEKGDVRKSIKQLEKAVEIDPGYTQAYNNLGSRYVSLKEYGKAIAAFRTANGLDPESEMVQTNLALALMFARDYPEAEKAARRALEMGHSRKACLVLGVSLKEQWRSKSEALEHLAHAAAQFPKARLAMAEILAADGQQDRAAEEVKLYLAADKGPDSRPVKDWLARLEHH